MVGVNLKDRPRRFSAVAMTLLLNAEQAMGAADILRQSKKVIGIGSPRASIESNLCCVSRLAENFCTGIKRRGEQERLQLALKVLREGGIYTPALWKSNLMTRYWYWAKTLPRPARALRWRVRQR